MTDSNKPIRAAVLGASGYTGADMIRLAALHPAIKITALIAKGHAGQSLAAGVSASRQPRPAASSSLPTRCDWDEIDVAFCGLPHGTAHSEISEAAEARQDHRHVGGFSPARPEASMPSGMANEHSAPRTPQGGRLRADRALSRQDQSGAARGLSGLLSDRGAACAAAAGQGEARSTVDDLIIDAKSGVSGAGRTLKQNILFSEAGEGLSPYGIGSHRHVPEIEQELGAAAGAAVAVNFTPHLVPMSRGELCTCYVRLAGKTSAADLRSALTAAYVDSPFVRIVEEGVIPATQHVRGSNFCHIGVFADRITAAPSSSPPSTIW